MFIWHVSITDVLLLDPKNILWVPFIKKFFEKVKIKKHHEGRKMSQPGMAIQIWISSTRRVPDLTRRG
jgi:hypothetical protein